MPNWCYNKLSVFPTERSKEGIEQLKKFIEDVNDDGEIVQLKEAKAFQKKEMDEAFEKRYRNDADMFVEHSEMSAKKFLTDILYFKLKEKDGIKFFQRSNSSFRMQRILPCPEELRNVTSPPRAENGEDDKQFKERVERHKKLYNATDWYGWQTGHWGTKWDVDGEVHSQTKYKIVYSYDTAWSPNTTFLYNICEKYPLLTFHIKYSEEGMGFRDEDTISF